MNPDSRFLEALRNSFNEIVRAPKEIPSNEMRTLSAKQVQQAFSSVRVEIKGSENLPSEQGVILVTTKKARAGYSSFNYSGFVTTQTLTRNFEIYDGQGFYDFRMDAWKARLGVDNPPLKFVWNENELDFIYNDNIVDWEDLALNDALLTSHSLSYSSGTEKSTVYSSLNYFTQDGIIPNSGFDRLQFKLNYSHQLTDKLSLDGIINIQNANQSRETGGLFLANITPIAKPYDDEGNLVKYYFGQENASAINPLWDQRESVDETETNLTDISLRFNYDHHDLTQIND